MCRYSDVLHHHLRSLGLRLNAQESDLAPSQQTTFMDVQFDFLMMQAHLAPARVSSLHACLACFRLGYHVAVGLCRLLGLMAAASPVLPLGLLHMRSFLWWMKLRHPPFLVCLPSAKSVVQLPSSSLEVERQTLFASRVKMGVVCHRQVVMTPL